MAIEEFSPEPPPPETNFGALWMGLLLVAIAVVGGIGIYLALSTGEPGKDRAAGGGPKAPEVAPPVRVPNVVEASEEALKASAEKGLSLVVTDVATTEVAGGVRWAGRVLLRNDGKDPVEVERPDTGNSWIEEETTSGPHVRSRPEGRAVERVQLAPGASVGMEWQDEFDRSRTVRFRFVHAESAGEEKRVVATPWIDVPQGGK